jgi:hypothetical protein
VGRYVEGVRLVVRDIPAVLRNLHQRTSATREMQAPRAQGSRRAACLFPE